MGGGEREKSMEITEKAKKMVMRKVKGGGRGIAAIDLSVIIEIWQF